MTANTDRLIELILQEDKDVLCELLTTDRVVFDAEPGRAAISVSLSAAEASVLNDPKQPRREGQTRPVDDSPGDPAERRDRPRADRAGRETRQDSEIPDHAARRSSGWAS